MGQAIAAATAPGPVTVRVVATPPANPVLLWPLELAHAGGKPLAARGDVSFPARRGPDENVDPWNVRRVRAAGR